MDFLKNPFSALANVLPVTFVLDQTNRFAADWLLYLALSSARCLIHVPRGNGGDNVDVHSALQLP